MTLHFLARHLRLTNQLDLELRELVKAKKKPTLIRLSNKASVKYVTECKFKRISEGPKFHLGPGCLVEIRYNDSFIRWFKIEHESA